MLAWLANNLSALGKDCAGMSNHCAPAANTATGSSSARIENKRRSERIWMTPGVTPVCALLRDDFPFPLRRFSQSDSATVSESFPRDEHGAAFAAHFEAQSVRQVGQQYF